MAIILFSRPDHDDIIAYLHFYSKHLVEYAQECGHDPIDCDKERANRKDIHGLILKKRPVLMMFNGHGNETCICGHKDEVLLESEKDCHLLKEAIIYCLSCESILGLGKKAVETGTLAFIGYKGKVAIGKDKRYEAAPHKDNVAKLFLEPSNILMSSLIKGSQVQVAIEKCKNKMRENISKLRLSTESIDQDALPFLYYNYSILDYYGDGNAFIGRQ